MKVLGIDHGTEKIGFAISDDDNQFARPLKTVRIASNASDVDVALDVILEENPEEIVVGMPLGFEGKVTKQSLIVENFIKKLSELTFTKIIKWNESYSSEQAAILKSQKKTGDVDSEAARIILQEYLDFINTGI